MEGGRASRRFGGMGVYFTWRLVIWGRREDGGGGECVCAESRWRWAKGCR